MRDLFEGVRALDLTQGIPGAFAVRLLADNGADVIKVEPPGGDPLRGQDGGIDFAYSNAGKRSAVLDVSRTHHRALLSRLLDRVDVVVDSFTAAERERFDASPDRLREGREQLIAVSVTPFGHSGPYRDWRASEHVVYAMGHEMSATGQADLPPGPMAPFVTWLTVGFGAAMVTSAALYAVLEGRGGAAYEIAAMESMAASIDRRANGLVAYAYSREPLHRGGVHAGFPPAANRCADGWVSLSANGGWWEPFRQAVQIPEFLTEEYAQNPDPRSLSPEAWDAWQQWCLRHTKREITDLLQGVGVPAEPMNTMADLLSDEHLRSRSYFEKVSWDGNVAEMPGPVVRLIGTEANHDIRHSPELGQHTEEVLRELGCSDEEIARLLEDTMVSDASAGAIA